jgi:perosamine synthetase
MPVTLWAQVQGAGLSAASRIIGLQLPPVKHLADWGRQDGDDGPRLDFAEARRFRNHGMSSDARQRQMSGQWHYEMVVLGFNYRLTDVACALGLSQLKKLGANLTRRREIAALHRSLPRHPRWHSPSVRAGVKPAASVPGPAGL